MDWLTSNPIADMHGPVFLIFYGGAIALTLAACWLARRRLDWTAGMPPPAIPAAPDPHEIAYLRGGESEVTRSVVFALVQRGLLEVKTVGTGFYVGRAAGVQDRRSLSPIERRAYDWFSATSAPIKTESIFRDDALPSLLRPFCSTYENNLRRERLINSEDERRAVARVALAGALVIVGLGGYKLLIALSRGRTNVGFLIVFAVVGLVVLYKICRLPRISARGREYLERLRLAFEWLKSTRPAPAVSAAGGDYAAAHAFDPSLLMLVGVFGVGALAGTQYNYFQDSFRRAAVADTSGSYSGSSCGSSCNSSSGGGSSCAGGSSSGSSCGSSCGGGCGGGGCGGCGS
ncbi:MAG TPA: TIGR04222 domain-containing membrane protein [Pyrinomonadaceae bacterium]|nr:TIGR04222 domain-containing membrane protein [Pyrinomonadaceae bacterium]